MSSPARGLERELAPHPSLKPQAFLRQLTDAALPLNKGTILDPFMGSGSTIAASRATQHKSIGIEANSEYYALAKDAIPRLASYNPRENGRNGTKR